MDDQYARTRMLLGGEGMARLRASRVAVFGLGGVGSYAFEALVRSGVGAVDVIDNDIISVSNLNRQLLALRSTVGMKKTDAAAARAADIDPETVIRCYPSCAQRTRACRSSQAWERATSSIPPGCGSPTSPRRGIAIWRA